jgi:hypothetical protein
MLQIANALQSHRPVEKEQCRRRDWPVSPKSEHMRLSASPVFCRRQTEPTPTTGSRVRSTPTFEYSATWARETNSGTISNSGRCVRQGVGLPLPTWLRLRKAISALAISGSRQRLVVAALHGVALQCHAMQPGLPGCKQATMQRRLSPGASVPVPLPSLQQRATVELFRGHTTTSPRQHEEIINSQPLPVNALGSQPSSHSARAHMGQVGQLARWMVAGSDRCLRDPHRQHYLPGHLRGQLAAFGCPAAPAVAQGSCPSPA